jgi:hypothetical protein
MLGAALNGDASRRRGPARSLGYRWFTDPGARRRHPEEDHEFLSRLYASGLRERVALRGSGSRAAELAARLLGQSAEFREVWDRHEVGLRPGEGKRYLHPDLGLLELDCQTLVDPAQSHSLLVYTATPGTETYEKLQLLAVLGARHLADASS